MILIGMPVFKRDWILPYWFEAIEKQTVPLSELGFIFEMGNDDKATHDILWEWHMNHPEVTVFDGVVRETVEHKHHDEGKRRWGKGDYEKMAQLRNHLLDRVIAIQPDAYFSLDSDILLENSQTIEILFELVQRHEAVSTLSQMWPTNSMFPSVMSWVHQPGGPARRMFERYNFGELFRTDIIMASIMMSPKVYNNVRYQSHPLGEDLGWSYQAFCYGFSLWCASFIYTPHIMHKSMLQPYLEYGDPRSPMYSS